MAGMGTVSRKICLIGDFSVGKTSLIGRFVHQIFSDKYHSTLGVKIDSKTVSLAGHPDLKLMIWDIAGKDAFSTMDHNYLRGMAGYILAVDGTRYRTLKTAVSLQAQISAEHGDPPAVCVLNKSDLADQWDVSDRQVDELGIADDCLFRTSAKTGENVDAAFSKLAQILVAQ